MFWSSLLSCCQQTNKQKEGKRSPKTMKSYLEVSCHGTFGRGLMPQVPPLYTKIQSHDNFFNCLDQCLKKVKTGWMKTAWLKTMLYLLPLNVYYMSKCMSRVMFSGLFLSMYLFWRSKYKINKWFIYIHNCIKCLGNAVLLNGVYSLPATIGCHHIHVLNAA